MSRLFIFLAVIGLTSCASWGHWGKAPIGGPVVGPSNKRGDVYLSCSRGSFIAQRYGSGGGMCKTAFMTASGNLLEMQSATEELDTYLRSLKEFSTWPLVSHGSYSKHKTPYSFYLLTIEPLVVLVAPTSGRGYGGCSGPFNGAKCVGSKLIEDGYRYDVLPKSQGPVYWFAPGYTKDLVQVPSDQLPYRLPIANIEAEIGRSAEGWTFNRER